MDLRLPAMGLAANVSLEVAGRNVAVETGSLTLEGSLPALSKALRVGEGSPVFGGLRLERQALDDLLPFEAVTLGNIGRVNYLGQGRFYLSKFDEILDTAGVRSVRFKRGLLLGEAKALRTFSSVGLTGVIDIGFELYEFGTSTGQWGNPYLTLEQKRTQAVLEIGSDIALAVGLALLPVDWYIAIPAAFAWAVTAPDIFANAPITSRAYSEARDLRPLP